MRGQLLLRIAPLLRDLRLRQDALVLRLQLKPIAQRILHETPSLIGDHLLREVLGFSLVGNVVDLGFDGVLFK